MTAKRYCSKRNRGGGRRASVVGEPPRTRLRRQRGRQRGTAAVPCPSGGQRTARWRPLVARGRATTRKGHAGKGCAFSCFKFSAVHVPRLGGPKRLRRTRSKYCQYSKTPMSLSYQPSKDEKTPDSSLAPRRSSSGVTAAAAGMSARAERYPPPRGGRRARHAMPGGGGGGRLSARGRLWSVGGADVGGGSRLHPGRRGTTAAVDGEPG